MIADESRLLGEIKGILETVRDSHGKQLGTLFEKTDEISRLLTQLNGTVKNHDTRLTRLEFVGGRLLMVGLLLLAGGGATGALITRLVEVWK